MWVESLLAELGIDQNEVHALFMVW